MLSIGLFSYSVKPRGSVVHAACLAEALERKGAQVTLYALGKPGDAFFRSLTCPLQLIPAGPAPDDVDALIQQRIGEFRAGIRALAPRHSIYHAEDCLAANALVAAKAELGKSLVARTVHHVEDFASPYLMACQARSVMSADLLLTVSERTRREVWRSFEREAHVISNGVDVQRFAVSDSRALEGLRSQLALSATDTLVLSVGGVELRKNSLNALQAVALAFTQHPNVRWLIAGGASIWEHAAYREEFAQQLARLPQQLQARISVLGTVSESDLTALYQLSDILLCPSLQEGFGLCVLEALAAQCAVIAPEGPPFDEYLDERCASFVDPSSVTEISGALLALLRDPEQRRQASANGQRRAQRYSWDQVAERHLVRYEAALAVRSAGYNNHNIGA